VGEYTVTQPILYTSLFVIGIPMMLYASLFGTFFWLVGASAIVILGHASFIEPGIESEYATVQDSV
jgi:PRA1 family protein 1